MFDGNKVRCCYFLLEKKMWQKNQCVPINRCTYKTAGNTCANRQANEQKQCRSIPASHVFLQILLMTDIHKCKSDNEGCTGREAELWMQGLSPKEDKKQT